MAGLYGARIRRGAFTGGARGREGEDEKLRGSGEGYAAGREWYWRVEADRTPDREMPIVEPWKCPYHNGRMCFEVIKRFTI